MKRRGFLATVIGASTIPLIKGSEATNEINIPKPDQIPRPMTRDEMIAHLMETNRERFLVMREIHKDWDEHIPLSPEGNKVRFRKL